MAIWHDGLTGVASMLALLALFLEQQSAMRVDGTDPMFVILRRLCGAMLCLYFANRIKWVERWLDER
jgi:hypothetical protein